MIPGNFRFSLKSILLILVLISFSSAIKGQKKTKIKFKADNIEYDEKLGNKARRLIGRVVFRHRGAVLYCDSAYHYTDKNSLDAFGNVHMQQGDSLNLYTDSLYYDGNTEIFTCKNNVVLDNKDIHLTTDYLIYDRAKNYGFYLSGGNIVNRKDNSTLESKRGYYYTDLDDFYFKKDVIYIHPEFNIEADTLLYNGTSKRTTFLGPTFIHADSSLIYCENGFFNSVSGESEYHKNAYIKSETRVVSGDSIFYNSKSQIGQILGNANILDTAENISVRGEIAWLYEDRDSAVVTVNTELQQYFDEDTLFLHADTFKVYKNREDSSRYLKAYWHVRFFKSDLQGKCDSMVYSFGDSAIKMFRDPIIWSAENQITGDYIQINTAEGQMHSIEITKNAFVASIVDSVKFNQIRGKEMIGYFKDNELDVIDVSGNGQTIYYALDDEDKFVGVNRGESSDLKIKLVDQEINQISYINDGNATFFPIWELTPKELTLRGFTWRDHIRPKKRGDIFIWIQ